MDSSAPFPLFSSPRVVGDMNGRPFIPLKTTRPTAFSPLSEQQPAEIRPTTIEVAWPVTAGLGVGVLKASYQTLSSDRTHLDKFTAAQFMILIQAVVRERAFPIWGGSIERLVPSDLFARTFPWGVI
ncbi:hypothetical protein AVEN_214867-1 [Araneus ventricosus]|uniref:Uncharacterized protein n=1 Tax=Araneus ventricosus TaxID=182803 RepID=A0A4Y2HJK2_ARAVE|nr:hypothetical protein AVEN_214867-1 [Araneus ventricosus]